MLIEQLTQDKVIIGIILLRGVYMNIIKRNGSQASYDSDKIRIAIAKANATVPEEERLSADVKADGAINGMDANILSQFLAGAIGSLE